ncbi:unnamed protein product, partial [Rotaria sp. Silwood2]
MTFNATKSCRSISPIHTTTDPVYLPSGVVENNFDHPRSVHHKHLVDSSKLEHGKSKDESSLGQSYLPTTENSLIGKDDSSKHSLNVGCDNLTLDVTP